MHFLKYLFSDFKSRKTHTDPCPEGIGGVASAALVKLLAAAVRNHVLVQGSVPVIVAHHSTTSPLETEGKIKSLNSSRGYKGHYRMTIKLDKKKRIQTLVLYTLRTFPLMLMCVTYLSLYGVPCIPQAGVVIRAVQHQPFFQVPSGVFAHLGKQRCRGGSWDT